MEIVGMFNKVMKEDFEIDPIYEYIDTRNMFGAHERYECRLRVPGLAGKFPDVKLIDEKETNGVGQQKKMAQQKACEKYAKYLIEKGVVAAEKFPGIVEGSPHPVEIKAAIYSSFGKQKLELPTYEITETGDKPDERVYHAHMKAHDHVTIGSGSSKKDAQTEAAWHMATWLVERAQMDIMEVPPFPLSFQPNAVKTALCKAMQMAGTVSTKVLRLDRTLSSTFTEPSGDDDLLPVGKAKIVECQMELDLQRPLHKHETKGSGANKEEAETQAAWLMAKYLVEQQIVRREDLPPSPDNIKFRDREYYQLCPDLQQLADIFANAASIHVDEADRSSSEKENKSKMNDVGGEQKQPIKKKNTFFN